jgi:type I restriction enzyme S subunit
MKNRWALVPLGEILDPVSRPERVDPTATYSLLGAHWYATGLYTKEILSGSQICADKLYRVEQGDFVYNRLFAWKGSFAIASKENKGCFVSNEFPCFRIDPERADAQFLWRYFSRSSAWDEALGLSAGGTPTSRNRLKEEKLLAMTVPLPPLAEQRRVVARIEELAAQIHEACTLRHEASEEAEALLPSMKTKAYGEAIQIAGGTERLETLCDRITDGTHVTPRYVAEGIPFISVKDITSGVISFDSSRRITREQHDDLTKRCRPERDDILLTKVGTIGYAKVIDVDREFSIFVSLALLKLKKDLVLPRFMEHILTSTTIRDQALSDTRGVGNQNLVLKFIKEFPIPVPPLTEQRRIVAELDALQAEVDALKRLQAETAAELDALLPSILDKAFKGEL